VVGSENRIKLIARDLVEHFETRLATMEGKAMVAVMSRRIAVELYRELIALRPAWHGDGDDQGTLKVVMTGADLLKVAHRHINRRLAPDSRQNSAPANPPASFQ
jgi:type I site-specific restriction-modification system R (restriction) subunit